MSPEDRREELLRQIFEKLDRIEEKLTPKPVNNMVNPNANPILEHFRKKQKGRCW